MNLDPPPPSSLSITLLSYHENWSYSLGWRWFLVFFCCQFLLGVRTRSQFQHDPQVAASGKISCPVICVVGHSLAVLVSMLLPLNLVPLAARFCVQDFREACAALSDWCPHPAARSISCLMCFLCFLFFCRITVSLGTFSRFFSCCVVNLWPTFRWYC